MISNNENYFDHFLMLFSLIPECKSQEFDAGGYDSLYTVIKQETLLPDSCEQPGKVFVSFTISETGDIYDEILSEKNYSEEELANIGYDHYLGKIGTPCN